MHRFTGYYKDFESGMDYANARYRDIDFKSVDPHAESYPHISPYNYAGWCPTMITDPTGMDWYKAEDGTVTWTDHTNQKAMDDNNVTGTYMGKAVVTFDGSRNEKLGKGDNLFGEGANLATATVYGPNGADDIQTYDAFTMSSDFSKFGAIADGEYDVNYKVPGKGGALKSNWAVNNTDPVDCLDGKNPSRINPYSKTQKNQIWIHSSNRNGKMLPKDREGNTHPVSTGCLIIVPSKYDGTGKSTNNGWHQFNKQLEGVKLFKLILNRK
jgi:hypothetical protein